MVDSFLYCLAQCQSLTLTSDNYNDLTSIKDRGNTYGKGHARDLTNQIMIAHI